MAKRQSFKEQNLIDWEKTIKDIFSDNVPKVCVWENKNSIVNILNKVSSINSLNHAFFPTGGGQDLEGASLSWEPECINLISGRVYQVLKPEKLIFHSFKEDDQYEWAYFRLETNKLSPTGIYESLYKGSEELVDLGTNEYANRKVWDQDFLRYDEDGNEIPLPKKSRLVTRFLEGSFVIFSKASLYNNNPNTYDARHNEMTDKDFRRHIEDVITYVKE